jgi:hypothetical protein
VDPIERMEVYRSVRAILVRNYVDLGRLVIQIATGTVHLRGTLQRLMGSAPLSPEVVQGFLQEIRRIRGVRRVITDFDNWTVSDDARTLASKQDQAPPPAAAPETPFHDLSGETPPEDAQS